MSGVGTPRGAWSWATYDLANTIFSMNVISLYFPQWVVEDRGRADLWVSVAFSASMLAVALTLPYQGLWSDRRGRRIPFLLVYTAVAVAGTALLGPVTRGVGTGIVLAALGLFALSNYAYQGAQVFYNALLPSVSTPATRGRVSGLGVGLGYVGSFVGLLLVAPFVEGKMPILGWTYPGIAGGGRSAAFLPTAALFALFSIPVFLGVREGSPGSGPAPSRSEAWRDIRTVLRDRTRYPGVGAFLLGNLLVVDAIHTVILFMAVFAQRVMGLPDSVKITFFLLATAPAILGSFVAGWCSDRFGPRRAVLTTAGGWVMVLAATAFTRSVPVFYVLGGLVGMLLGSTWTTSRALLLTLTPPQEEGRLFGLLAFSNKAAAVVGPLLWGLTVLVLEGLGPLRYRVAVGVLALMALTGTLVLRRVPAIGDRRRSEASR